MALILNKLPSSSACAAPAHAIIFTAAAQLRRTPRRPEGVGDRSRGDGGVGAGRPGAVYLLPTGRTTALAGEHAPRAVGLLGIRLRVQALCGRRFMKI